ncbi:MAG: hypothetical protein GX567_16310 [Clostridia bacterium]|jgi:hypothetical protein|nr:hypothetical protein [Clostridia bacterium]HKM21351.1 hypothetical protein [Lachnospiraceae bacterium]
MDDKDSSKRLTEQIMKREKFLRCKRLKRQIGVLSAMLPVLMLTLIVYVHSFAESLSDSNRITAAYGASLAASGAGGYVLTAVLAFVLGACITMLCVKMRQYLEQNQNQEDKKGRG